MVCSLCQLFAHCSWMTHSRIQEQIPEVELDFQIQRLTSTNQGSIERRASPVGIPQGSCSYFSRRKSSTWLETDLDTLETQDRGCDSPETVRLSSLGRKRDPFPYSPSQFSGREVNTEAFYFLNLKLL